MSISATPFRIHDENDYIPATANSARLTTRKGLGPLTPAQGKTASKPSLVAPKSQRKALGNLTTGNLNVRSAFRPSESSVKSRDSTVVKFAVPTQLSQNEDEFDPLDMVCSGAQSIEDPYDSVMKKAAALTNRPRIAPTGGFDDFPDGRNALEDLTWTDKDATDLFMPVDYDEYSL